MGCSNTKVLSSDGFYGHGPADFEFDTKKALFEKKNGLLFRLVNSEKKQWGYYNDTKEYEFHVTVVFGSNSSNLIALGKTTLTERPDGTFVATSVIHPGHTEPFIQGDISGFKTTAEALYLDPNVARKLRSEHAHNGNPPPPQEHNDS